MIKQWHALLAMVLTPYFFYWVTPHNRAVEYIGLIMALLVTAIFAAIAFDKDARNSINKELEK